MTASAWTPPYEASRTRAAELACPVRRRPAVSDQEVAGASLDAHVGRTGGPDRAAMWQRKDAASK